MDATDWYRILQVDSEADYDVIRAAHRVLAAKHHPDKGGSLAAMSAINHAWTILSDRTDRAEYDRQRRLRTGADRWDAYGKAARTAAAPVAPKVNAQPGTILEFGRYIGWTIPEVAAQDPDFLEWFVRTPNGRRHEREIDACLGRQAADAAGIDPMVWAHARGH